MARKNLNDTIHGDRAIIRGGSVHYPKTSTYSGPVDEGFTDRLFSKDTQEKKFSNAGGSVVRDFLDHDTGKYSSGGTGYKSGEGYQRCYQRCYHSHPALTLPNSTLQIFGGSCIDPSVKDADVYIGFDSGMRFTQRHWPWKKGTEILFKITDMSVPTDPAEFKKLIKWTREQLEKGLKVHCGCIGGHGRTGTFFAALCSDFGETDATTYVRKNYCKRVVESSEQINFLFDHFGVKKVSGSKSGGVHSGSSKTGGISLTKRPKPPEVYAPLPSEGSIFAPPFKGL